MPYYTATGAPVLSGRGSSATIRAEFAAVQAGFTAAGIDITAIAAAVGVSVNTVEVDLASAATCTIGAASSSVIRITGTVGINSLGTSYTGVKYLRFEGILTLTNGSALVCEGGANVTTEAGDTCFAIPIGNPATGWRLQNFTRMGQPMLADSAVRKAGSTMTGVLTNASGFVGPLTGTASLATDLTGGLIGQIPYQNAVNDTVLLVAGTAGQVLQANGAAAPSWATSVTRATNLAGGLVGQIPYQSAVNATALLAAGTAGQVLQSNAGAAPSWVTALASGTTATTQAAADNSTKVATTAYADRSGPKAWCYFNGNTAGTNAPTAGYNVTSVTRNGVGDYTINFTTALTNANYSATGMASAGGGFKVISDNDVTTARTTTAFRILSVNSANAAVDSDRVSIQVFGA